jgi:DNA-binding HxlR family transcriptional regulator
MSDLRPKLRIEDLEPGTPTWEALDRIADRWTVMIATVLEEGPTRFNEIRRRIGISAQALTRVLRNLERDALVERRAYLEVPVRVEYRLTALGETMCPILHAVRTWAEAVAPAIAEARARYDARPPSGDQ